MKLELRLHNMLVVDKTNSAWTLYSETAVVVRDQNNPGYGFQHTEGEVIFYTTEDKFSEVKSRDIVQYLGIKEHAAQMRPKPRFRLRDPEFQKIYPVMCDAQAKDMVKLLEAIEWSMRVERPFIDVTHVKLKAEYYHGGLTD